MNWERARNFCSNRNAEMVVIESEVERQEIAKMTAHLLKKRWRFWVGVKRNGRSWKMNSGKFATYQPWGKDDSWKGDCVRIGGNTKWYKAACSAKSLPGGYTLNPFCKKSLQASGNQIIIYNNIDK